jgi:prepilin-type N-terminal cleavage/methylation domain-containing protein
MTAATRSTAVRAGFTLLEVMVALTLTAIAAAIASGSLTAARRTSETIAIHQQTGEADARVRVLLATMLRHGGQAATRGDGTDLPLLRVTPDGSGALLAFQSRGVESPYGTGPIWWVQLSVRDGVLQLRARPIDAREATRHTEIETTVADARPLVVAVLEGATGFDAPRWRADWPLAQQRPRAISLDWSGGTRPPLVVDLDPLAMGTP